jgi:predicted HAD superfamily Cof-like phosphohydrolase
MDYYYDSVKEFTYGAMGEVPTEMPMNAEKTAFIVQMMLSELIEFMQPTAESEEEILNTLRDDIASRINRRDNYPTLDTQKLVFEVLIQGIIGKNYVSNFKECFDEVHGANMSKRFEDGKFHKNEIGKVIKPPGWKEPNLESVVVDKRQLGSQLYYEYRKGVIFSCGLLCDEYDLDLNNILNNTGFNRKYDYAANESKSSREILVEQIDAIIDLMYYVLDTCARHAFKYV